MPGGVGGDEHTQERGCIVKFTPLQIHADESLHVRAIHENVLRVMRTMHKNLDGWIASEKIAGFANGQLFYINHHSGSKLYWFADNPERMAIWKVIVIDDCISYTFRRIEVGTPEYETATQLRDAELGNPRPLPPDDD